VSPKDRSAISARPPAHSRFRKGQSGNPSGRPKQVTKEAERDDREIVLSQLVTTTIGGKRVKITARRALYQKLVAMSFDGNLRAIALLLKFDGLNDNGAASTSDAQLTTKEEEALLARFLAREGRRDGGGDE
jgi:hypothetical protein